MCDDSYWIIDVDEYTDSDSDGNKSTASFCSLLVSELDGLRRARDLCDFTIISCDGLPVQVHRVVMVVCSQFFQALLIDGLCIEIDSVTLEEVSIVGLQAVVDFAYSGRVTRIDSDSFEEVLAAAVYLQVHPMVKSCAKIMQKICIINNVVDMLDVAERYALFDRQREYQKFIIGNFLKLIDNLQFLKFTCSQLKSFLPNDRLTVSSEYQLFQAVLRWIDHDKSQREKHAEILMQHIRFPLFSKEELASVWSINRIVTNAEFCQLLTEAEDYHQAVSKRPSVKSHQIVVHLLSQ